MFCDLTGNNACAFMNARMARFDGSLVAKYLAPIANDSRLLFLVFAALQLVFCGRLTAQQVAPFFSQPAYPQASATPVLTGLEATTTSPTGGPNRLGPGRLADAGSGVRPSPVDPSQPPSYKPLRYDEDYRYLQDPNRWTDFWDPIKYVPLFGRDDSYLSLGGEARERFETVHNDSFGLAPANAQGFNSDALQRYMLHGDLHVGPQLRLFGQVFSGQEDGRIGGPRPEIDRDAFDVHQAFVDWVSPLAENDSLTWRVGRQEFKYGSGRLIDVREGPNLRLSFDAARVLAKVGDWSADGWWSQPVRNRPGAFDDDPDPARSFWGLYATGPFRALSQATLDLYYLGYENHEAVYEQGPGNELRHTLGTRLAGKPMPWEYNLEYAWQFGTFGAGTINAWTAANAVRYNFNELPLSPRLGLRADIASGDRNAASPSLQTFNPLFPSGVYFNLADPVGPLNLIDLHPVLDLHFGDKLTLTADWDFFWRESLGDGVYRLSGSLLTASKGSTERFVGSSPAATLVWTPTRHVTLLAGYVHFFAGPFLQATTPGKDLDYFTTWLTYKF